MKCNDCEYEFQEDDIFFDTGFGNLCEICIDDYIEDLKNGFEREYDPKGENEDFLLDQERGK